jgi:hypothetical protein
MIMKRIVGLKFLAVALLSLGLTVAQAETPDATIKLSAGSAAIGVGVSWGSGTLTYKGKTYPIEVDGLSVGDVGMSKIEATGNVYHLKSLDDFNGSYSAIGAGVTAGGGGAASTMQNQNGVRVDLVSNTKGVQFTFGPSGVTMKLKK